MTKPTHPEWNDDQQQCGPIDDMKEAGPVTGEYDELKELLYCAAGVALEATDGFTRLKPQAREMIANAADAIEALTRERDEARAALEFIAEAHDAGRHDGLPEPCPAHDADTMWAIAVAALSPKQEDGS